MVKMKPHREGFENEEDCVGHYDPDEEITERRGCSSCRHFDHRVSDSSVMTGRECYQMWVKDEEQKRQEWWDAKTPEEKAQHEEFSKGLRELY